MAAEVLPFDLWGVAQAAAERLGLYAVFTAWAAKTTAEAPEVVPADTQSGTPPDRWEPNWTISRDPKVRHERDVRIQPAGDVASGFSGRPAVETPLSIERPQSESEGGAMALSKVSPRSALKALRCLGKASLDGSSP